MLREAQFAATPKEAQGLQPPGLEPRHESAATEV
jgi:hypothetical protein